MYGKLYNWAAVNDPRGLAPLGWHIPSAFEWNILAKCLDPNADTIILGTQSHIAGGAMKETGFLHWQNPNTGATNSSGFTGLPSGIRGPNGNFSYLVIVGDFWSSTELPNPIQSWDWDLYNQSNALTRHSWDKVTGLAIRCVKD